MAIYLNDIVYAKAQPKRVALPLSDDSAKKAGYGSLVFLFTESVDKSISMIKNTDNCYHNNRYYYYYYPKRYLGKINGRRYNVNELQHQKNIYKMVNKDLAPIKSHPISALNTTPNRNCYFDMSKYIEIYQFMSTKLSTAKRISSFWAFFKSIWFSQETSGYQKKTILIDIDQYNNIKTGSLKEKLMNPLFMFYYTLYRAPSHIQDLDIDFVFYCGKYVLKINPKQNFTPKLYTVFYRELQVLMRKKSIEAFDPVVVNKDEQKSQVEENLQTKFNFVGNQSDDDDEVTNDSLKKSTTTTDNKAKDNIQKKIDNKIQEKIDKNTKAIDAVVGDKVNTDTKDYVQTQSEIDLDDDKELAEDLYKFIKNDKVPTTPLSTARDAALRKRQDSLKMKNISFADLKKERASKYSITTQNIGSAIKTINENVKTVKFNNINKDYIEKVMPIDIAKVFASLNKKDMKLFVRDVKIEDSSDESNYKDTYRVIMEDEHKQRHTITVDIPKFIDNKFLYLGSNKKIIDRQNFLYPIVKTGPDTVQIVTNYNKIFIRRLGTKSISAVERVMKLISSTDEGLKYFVTGNNSVTNRGYITSIEYDEFSKVLTEFKTDRCHIMFNQDTARKYLDDKGVEAFNDNDKYTFIGVQGDNYLFIDTDDQLVKSININDANATDDVSKLEKLLSNGSTISDIMVSELPDNLKNEFTKIRSTKKLMYSTATIMAQAIPFIVLMMFWEGFSSVVKKMNLKFYFSKTYPKTVKANEAVLRFKDCYFVYEEDLATSLLMNGLKLLDTENYSIKDYDTSEPYIEFFVKKYGKSSIMNAIYNYYEFLIDPITEEILEDINLPTDTISLCIYANSLLADESYTKENSQILSRVRSIEIIPAILYVLLSAEYINFKNSGGKKKISLPRDSVIKQLLALPTVEDYSVLNPVVELEKDRAITSKGFRGINLDRAYTEEKRSYDNTMLGVMSIDTSPDGNVGINRFLTMEPTIKSIRGYVDIKDEKNIDDLKDVNLFSPAELLYPLGNTRDDPVRVAMACKQSKHVIPVKNATPALISNGSDESIRFQLSSDFVVNAEEDGVVIDYDDKHKIMMLEYKSGKHRAVNLAPQIVKNGGGGFFLNNVLITKLKVGDKFRKNDAIAWHKDFFKEDILGSLRMNVGILEKVAIMSSYDTYNDSTVITQKLAEDSEALMTFRKQVVVGKNSNVFDIRKIGDHVSIGDPLMSFDTSFEDSELNKMLAKLSEKDRKTLDENSSNVIKSKYAGTIIDIKIYSTVELDDLSPSLQKIVKTYYNNIDSKKRFVSKYDQDPKSSSIVKCGMLLNDSSEKVNTNMYGVLRGQKVEESVLIEFYIEHGDVMGVGDKLA